MLVFTTLLFSKANADLGVMLGIHVAVEEAAVMALALLLIYLATLSALGSISGLLHRSARG